MNKLIVPVEEHYTGRVTFRGGTALEKIVAKFTKYGLMDQIKESPFKQFFLAPYLQFSASLIHQLLLRKVQPKYDDELAFFIGGVRMRFGIGEFGLITGLNCSNTPTRQEMKQRPKSTRLLVEHFINVKPPIKSKHLETAFSICKDKTDVWKLGLCYFLDGYLLGAEPSATLAFPDMLNFVEDEEFFFSIPWGNIVFEKTLKGLDQDMVHHRNNLLKKQIINKERKEKHEKALAGSSKGHKKAKKPKCP
jgi:hypothetical protein